MEPSRKAELVALHSADGTVLEGALLAAGPGARGVIVLCHPLLRHGYHCFLRSGFARWTAGAGFHAVLFNFQGIGRSALGNLRFADDVVGAIGWTRERFPGLPVHLAGLSFGGYQAAHALARLDGAVASAALDSVPPRIGNVFRSGPSSWLMQALSRSPWAVATGTRPVAASLARVWRTPLLLLYGDADEYCPRVDIDRLAAAVPAARLRILAGTGHGDGFLLQREAYARALLVHWGADVREVPA
jgi:pimeloyl-ACP methyl ester carboxylesterase